MQCYIHIIIHAHMYMKVLKGLHQAIRTDRLLLTLIVCGLAACTYIVNYSYVIYDVLVS